MACTLAESLNDPFHRRLRQLCCLHCRFDCCRVERTSSRAGVSPAEVQRLFTAHCYNNYGFGIAVGESTLRTPESTHSLCPVILAGIADSASSVPSTFQMWTQQPHPSS